MVFALRHPARCQRLIVADAASYIGPHLQAVAESWIRAAQTGQHKTFYRSVMIWAFSEQFFVAHHDLIMSRMEAAKQIDLASMAQIFSFGEVPPDITDRLGQIECPTCVIVGEQDIVTPVHYSRTIAEAIPKAELHVLSGAGHSTIWESAAEFNSIVLGFLRKG